MAAFHPDSVTKIAVTVTDDTEETVVEWEGATGTTELQEIVGLEGIFGEYLTIEGILDTGEYLGILEVRFFISPNLCRVFALIISVCLLGLTEGALITRTAFNEDLFLLALLGKYKVEVFPNACQVWRELTNACSGVFGLLYSVFLNVFRRFRDLCS